MVLPEDKPVANQQTKGDVTMESHQETGDSSPHLGQTKQVSKVPQEEQILGQAGAQESGTDTSVTMGLKKDYKPDEMDSTSFVAQRKLPITPKGKAVISLRLKNEVEIEHVRHYIIPMITKELRNKQKLCELVDHLDNYTCQCETGVQKLKPEFTILALKIKEVFAKPKILAQDIDDLLSKAEDLQKNVDTEDQYPTEDKPVPQVKEAGDSKHPQSSTDFEKKQEESQPTHCQSTPPNEDVKESKVEDGKETNNDEVHEASKGVEEKTYEVEGSAPKNTTEPDGEDGTLLGPHPFEVEERSISNEDIKGREESLPASSEEQSSSLIKGALSTMGQVVDASVQTDRETPQKETQVTAQVEIGTDHHPAEETEAVGQDDTTEAATAEQIIKKEEEVVSLPKQVKKSYAEVLKAGHASGSQAKQQLKGPGSLLKETKKAARPSSTQHLSPAPAVPTPSSAPSENLKTDGEGWQVVQERCSMKARLSSKSAETEQTKKKFDIKDYNPFSILMVSNEDLSAIDDDAVSDTEEPRRKELGGSSCATRVTSSQKKRKTRKSAGRRKKIMRGEDRQTKSRRKPSSNVRTIDTGGTLRRQGPASRWIKDEMERGKSAGHSSPKAGLKQKKIFKAKQQQSLQLSPPRTIPPSAPRSFHPPLNPKANQPNARYNTRYRSKDVGPSDRKKKKSWGNRGNPGSGNISRLEEQQVRVRRRPNSPSLPRSTHDQGRESRSRKRAKVDVHHRTRERKGGTGMRNNGNKRGQEMHQLRKTEPEQAVRPKQRLPNRLNDRGRLNKLHVKVREKNDQSTKSKKIAFVRPFRYLNNERASQRRRNIRYPDYGSINIIHNPLSPHSPNIPRSLNQDGLYNNMRGRSDHQEEFWRSGLSAVESARHWALPGEYTENRMRRMDRVLAQLQSGLPDQNISQTRDTIEPNGDGTISSLSPDVTPHIQQQEAAEDSTIYTSEDEDAQSRILPRLQRTLQNSGTSRNDPTGGSDPNNGNRNSYFQRPGASARDDVTGNSQGNVPVASSPWRGVTRLSHPGGRPPDAASQRNTPAPIRSGHRCGRPPNQTREGAGRSSQQQQGLTIARTNSCQELGRHPGRRDHSEERIVSCGGARPVCRVKPIQRQEGRSEEESRRQE